MPNYTFHARDTSGRPQTGTLRADSGGAATQILRERGWLITEVREIQQPRSVGEQLSQLNPGNFLPIRSVNVEMSCKQLALMLRGGLTLLAGLQAVAKQSTRQRLRQAWERVASRIQEGSGFADAMTETRCFPKLLIQLVRVGEQTGHLEQSLERAAEIMEGRRHLRVSLMTALAYPSIVLVASIAVTAFMVLGVIPKLKAFIVGLGKQLPPMTQLLLDISDFLQMHLLNIGIGILFVIGTIIALYCYAPTRLVMDRWLLRIPVVGYILRLASTANFARALGILLRSGITLLEGLRSTEDLMNNRHVRTRVTAARDTVMQGGNLADPLQETHAFTPLLSRMVAVGETSGTLDDVLDEVAKFHDAQLQSAIRSLSAVIEPIIIIVVGGIVGFVYISFFLALFSAGGIGR